MTRRDSRYLCFLRYNTSTLFDRCERFGGTCCLCLAVLSLTHIRLIKEVWGEVGLRFFLSILRAVIETLTWKLLI
jgi:hypothetical protein